MEKRGDACVALGILQHDYPMRRGGRGEDAGRGRLRRPWWSINFPQVVVNLPIAQNGSLRVQYMHLNVNIQLEMSKGVQATVWQKAPSNPKSKTP